jgi:hypothetical protein
MYRWAGFNSTTKPVLQSLIYNPRATAGNRFTRSANSTIARLYHSEALLLEDGRVLIAGSNPNEDANAKNQPFPDEKRIEVYHPSYLLSGLAKPVIQTLSTTNWFHNQVIQMSATIPSGNKPTAVLFTNGFVTHGVHMGQRQVELVVTVVSPGKFTLRAPPTPQLLPPGWYMLFVNDGPTPSGKIQFI